MNDKEVRRILNDMASLNLQDIKFIAAEIDPIIARKTQEAKRKALEAARNAASSFGYDLNDLVGAKPKKQSLPSRYVDPNNPGKTWTGCGRQPAWFKEALAKGHTPESMSIS